MQSYSDPRREKDPYSLPDVEIFYVGDDIKGTDRLAAHAAGIEPFWEEYDTGWYYWPCSPGCLPDSDPVGPFTTAEEARTAAQEENR